MKNRFEKIFFYSVPAIFAALVIFLMISGVPEIWFFLFLYVLPFAIGSYLLDQGKAFGCIYGIFWGISFAMNAFFDYPRRINMGNAGTRIEPTAEMYWRYFWNSEVIWWIAFSLFFLALGIYVLIKNRMRDCNPIKSGRIISAPTGISSKQKIQLSQNISKNFASLYMKGKFLPKQNNRAENLIKNPPSA